MSSDGSAWTPALLVPVAVEALPLYASVYAASQVTSEYSPWAFPFSWYEPSAPRTSQTTTEQRFTAARPNPLPGSVPFVPDPHTGGSGFTGVLLRWALPDGLTQGSQPQGADASSAMTFPAIPNRWLVLRSHVPGAGAAPQWSGWVVVSDGLGDLGSGDGVDFPGATPTSAPLRVGTVFALPAWQAGGGDPGPTLDEPLTAVGYGEASFAAGVPFSHGVCSFADTLAGLPTSGALSVSYAVCGWYADPASDPLHGTDATTWSAAVKGLRWGASDGTLDQATLTTALEAAADWAAAHGIDVPDGVAPLPTRSVYHGATFEVAWQDQDAQQTQPPEARSDPTTAPLVAMGSTAFDALSALLTNLVAPHTTDPDLTAATITAALLGIDALLEEPDGRAQLATALHATRFQSLPGGTRWTLGPAPPPPPTPPGADRHPVAEDLPDPGEYRAALAALNRAQSTLDRARLELALAQWHWYAQWVKQQQAVANLEEDLAKACALTAEVCAARAASATTAVTEAEAALSAALAGFADLPPGLVLDPQARTAYTRPNDPVVLVTGVGRAIAHGHDTAATGTDLLPCRLTGQTLSGYRTAALAADVGNAGLPPLTGAGIPAEVADLAVELALLDPALAATLAGAGAAPSAVAQLQADQALAGASGAWPPAPDPLPFTSLDGTETLPWNIVPLAWRAPWSPILLDWVAAFVAATGTGSSIDLSQWQPPSWTDFSVDAGPTWTPPPTPVWPSQPTSYAGRAILTPFAADLLLDRAAALPDDLRPSQAVLDALRSAPMLSQALSGFTDALLQRDPSLAFTASTHEGDGLPPVSPPAPFRANPSLLDAFQPLRAGWLRPSRLWVLDAFGQTVDLVTASGATAADISPWVSTEAAPFVGVGPSPMLLRPRLAQWARLTFELLTTDDDTVAADSGGPCVCGWLLMDWVDDAVAVYDDAGVYRGSVSCRDGSWSPAPDLAPPGGPPTPLLPDPTLAAVVARLSQPGSAAQVSQYVQDATWAAPATGTGAGGLLHAMVGTPLAVVRAELALDLPGPEYDEGVAATETVIPASPTPSWPPETAGTQDLALPVLLGTSELLDDGLVAFAVDGAADWGSPYADPPTTVPVSATTPVTMTMLMDPTRAVNAVSDCFPAQVLRLPLASQQAPTAQMELLFRFGPVLSAPSPLALPLPGLGAGVGTWSWLEYVTATQPALPQPTFDADTFAVVGAAPSVVHDGWLRLTTTRQPTVLSYVLTPAAVVCGEPFTLVLSVLNATTQPAVVDGITTTLPAALVPPGGVDHLVLAPSGHVGASAAAGPDGTAVITLTVPTPVPPGVVGTLQVGGTTAPATAGRATVVVAETAPGPDAGGKDPSTHEATQVLEWQHTFPEGLR